MANFERVIVTIFCVGCLAVPAAIVASGGLEPEEVHVVGDGTVTYTNARTGEGLHVKSYGKRNALPVATRNGGRPVVETNANDIPTTVVEEPVHTDGNVIPVRSTKGKGLRPEAPPEQ